MRFWSAESIRAVVGGTWLTPPPTADATGLSTDTRTLEPGQVFLALKGERFDGHTMLEVASGIGAPLAIIDNPERAGTLPPGLGVLRVADTGRALLKLGAAYRKTLDGTRVIAVAGSNGKTTTVRLIDAVLGKGGGLRGTHSQKSFNNSIGVPLTILGARPGDQYLICEIGTNAPGEIAALAGVVAPDVAVIVSIGREHLEKLGSLKGVAREEAHVLEFVRPGGAGIITADSPELLEVVGAMPADHKPRTMVTFGESPSAVVRVGSVEQNFEGVRFTLNDRAAFELPLLGRHNALNAAGAVAVGRRLGLSDEQVRTGLREARGAEMRLERLEIGGVRIINDAYNANPDSMRAALAAFAEIEGSVRRRVVILGDMLELGAHGDASHAEVLERLAALKDVDRIVLVGPSMSRASAALGAAADRTMFFEGLEGARASEVAALLQPGDLVLLKGSRGMRLERIVAALRAREMEPARARAAPLR